MSSARYRGVKLLVILFVIAVAGIGLSYYAMERLKTLTTSPPAEGDRTVSTPSSSSRGPSLPIPVRNPFTGETLGSFAALQQVMSGMDMTALAPPTSTGESAPDPQLALDVTPDVPKEFPEGFPVYDRGLVICFIAKGTRRRAEYILTMLTAAGTGRVGRFYEKQLPEAGFTIKQSYDLPSRAGQQLSVGNDEGAKGAVMILRWRQNTVVQTDLAVETRTSRSRKEAPADQ